MAALGVCQQGLPSFVASSNDVKCNLNPMTFTDQHGSIVLERLRYQRDNGIFCDVYLVVKDRQFSAHRNILAACSPYFDSILKRNKVIKEQVTVNCHNPAVFELLLNYMYSGTVVIDRSSVTDLLKLANNFLVTKLKNYCAEYLQRYMDASNCLAVKELAQKYNLPNLLKSACDYFDININRCLLESTDILEFSLPQLNCLLQEPKYRNIISPDAHLKLIARWVGHNPEQRDSLFKEMLNACPFSLVQPSTFEYLLDYSPFLTTAQFSRFTLLQAMCECSIPLTRYETQYRTLLAQFNNQVYMLDMNSSFGGATVVSPSGEIAIDINQPSTSNSLSMNGTSSQNLMTSQSATEKESTKEPSEASGQSCSIEDGQPPVLNASTTQEVLEASNPSQENGRPALKLKIQLNSVSLMNRKNRLLGKTNVGKSKFYRKSLSTANQVLAKRRGRPPKVKTSFLQSDVLSTNTDEEQINEDIFYPDCGIDLSEPVIFGEEDEFDPCSLGDPSEDEVEGTEPTDERPFKCEYCKHLSSTKLHQKRHMARIHFRDVDYVCCLCCTRFQWNRNYYLHMKSHYGNPPYHCDLCEFTGDDLLLFLSHRLTHSDERPFKCNSCGYFARTRQNMALHVRSHNGGKPFHCAGCGSGFDSKTDLDHHVSAQSASRPYQCSHCEFSTKYQSHLISHRRIHSGDVFRCHYEDCTYSSPKKSQLAAHLRTHLAVRAHQCKICNRSFIEKSHLVRHERIHLEDKPFKCDNCDYASSRRDKLKEHIQKHHSNAAIGKQQRRRYRRAKQLAQLAAAAQAMKLQPAFDSLFRPINESEMLNEQTSSVQGDLVNEQSGYLALGDVTLLPQDDVQGVNTTGQGCHQQTLVDLTAIGNVPGRPSSAMLPPSSTVDLSPTMSLNFHLGGTDTPLMGGSKDVTLAGVMVDSPIDSLRTPVPRSPHSVNLQPLVDPFGGSPNNGQDPQRPMSLPPLGGQQQGMSSQSGGSPWGW
ncbi:hypothetical protein AB6A40_004369 [Gnathostoma spinigerum]|uniref:Zinc finger protein n=1 Tax=Gnathostoma spinigerum TaxID=75299 RepID=A0ABD6ECB0_9BILA